MILYLTKTTSLWSIATLGTTRNVPTTISVLCPRVTGAARPVKSSELVIFERLDHQLDDEAAHTAML